MGWRIVRDPLTRKRWRRFKQRKRAYVSLWVLFVAYVLSLGSELLCNDRPLLMRFNGKWYVPVLRYYPDDTFTNSGLKTRPDYRVLAESQAFKSQEGNLAVFPPVPYGPYESIDPASLRGEETVNIAFSPIPRVASLDIDDALVVQRARAAGVFFNTNDSAVVGMTLDSAWQVPDALRAAVAQRLANAESPAWKGMLRGREDSKRVAEASMSRFSPRSRAPETTRLTLRNDDELLKAVTVTVNDGGEAIRKPRLWSTLSDDLRTALLDKAATAFTGYVAPDMMTIDGADYRVEISRNAITWPHEPVPGHWLGIDSAGRDVLARIVYGFRISISFALLLVVSTMVLGVIVGAVQGYFGGKTDLVMQRLIEIWSALPFLYVMILLGSVYGRSFGLLLFCYGIFNWIGISYYMRAEFLRLRRLPFVESARCMGVPVWRIMLRHVLPNALTPLITFFPFLLVGAIAALYGLDYLGFGLPPPTPSWGEMLHQAQQFRWAWWLILYPSAAIFAVMLLGVFVGEGIRDAFDPRAYAKME